MSINNTSPRFVLASASPARLKLLRMVGIEPIVCKSDFDEDQIQIEEAAELVTTLARCKAETVASQFTQFEFTQWKGALILGCDSVLTVNDEASPTLGDRIYGKPESPQIAIARWQSMRGKMGKIYTGHALIDLERQRQIVRCGVTRVYFANLSDRTIEAYIATGEPLNCAGGFALEGKGGMFVEKIEGCHSNVIGLSLPLLYQMMESLGYNVTNFWN
ncbi:MAG: septum formation inhibitor Maf [Hydrococcus sp. SU_1_0]|nr:septum formation inhibitor Maf [Hydrococcus sp. SU_1_0]